MKINIYDFDETIYDGNSAIDIYLYCIRKNILCLTNLPKVLFYYGLYFIHKKTKEEIKSVYYSFIKYFDNIESVVEDFWDKNYEKIKDFYINNNHKNDIIISATPEILLKPVCDKLEVKDLIGSVINKETGKFLRKNCKGVEKVIRFREKYPNQKVNSSYSDSFSDQPIFDIAQNAYLVKRNKIFKIK